MVDVETGVRVTAVIRDDSDLHPQWAPDSRHIYGSQSKDMLYSLPISFSGGSFSFGQRENLTHIDISDWEDFRVVEEDGSFVVLKDVDPWEGRDYSIFEWWQNFDTQLERISPSDRR